MIIRMGVMRMNMLKGVKIGFISLLVVSSNISPSVSIRDFPQAAFLILMAWPSIEKYLDRGVMVEISKIPEAEDGQPRLEPIATPAITFCPYKDLK